MGGFLDVAVEKSGMARSVGGVRIIDGDEVRARLTPRVCLPLVREAMIALSDGRVRQLLRSFIPLGPGQTFAIMPAAMGGAKVFGAKLISVFQHPNGPKTHEGLVALFDGVSGAPIGLVDASAVTEIRTAAASAAATDALARPDATVLAVLGVGLQAAAHIDAIAAVRSLSAVRVWGRSLDKAQAFAAETAARTGLDITALADPASAVAGADIVCTVTGATDPILKGEWVSPGAHVNAVGSSGPGQAELDAELVVASRFIVDHAEHVRVHGGEFLRAKAAGRIDDSHIVGEIGAVFAGVLPGRTSPDEITLYKSLGHAAQDLAVAAWLVRGGD
jgi:ornithine cyclodeaminase/alanine dehydrogenase-like protein (mu-crystallin family)